MIKECRSIADGKEICKKGKIAKRVAQKSVVNPMTPGSQGVSQADESLLSFC